jgi:hypothetical protein
VGGKVHSRQLQVSFGKAQSGEDLSSQMYTVTFPRIDGHPKEFVLLEAIVFEEDILCK